MRILAIDPGNEMSALVAMNAAGGIVWARKLPNEKALKCVHQSAEGDVLVVEMIESFGMAVGKEVFETVWWIGRFCEAHAMYDQVFHRVYRKDVKLHFCNSMRAKDGNIRQALIDRFGGKAAIGKKASPGPLYGLSGDLWQAYAAGLCWRDKQGVSV